LFQPGWEKRYDAVVAMYHDQGLLPIKTLSMHHLVNLTLGLPFIRTSPAHGTAFDLVGQNLAQPSSMRESIKLALDLTKRKMLQEP
jgi:4-hydroxythreonine-4-phosphate dehydrogenase